MVALSVALVPHGMVSNASLVGSGPLLSLISSAQTRSQSNNSGIAANPALAGLQGHGRPYRASGSVMPARPSPPRGSLALPSEAGSGAEERSSEEMAKLLRLQKIIVPWMNKVLEADGIVVDDLNEEDFADGVMLLMVIARTIRPPGLAYHAVPLNGAQIESVGFALFV